MEKEMETNIIKTTQNILGKYVKRPPLTEKLLNKPPFRFLHDIFTTVLKTTGFFEGLFDEQELISENVKDRESKILFLNKVIAVIGYATGKTLTVKSSKIVAGQEPEKTNELLQCLGQALDKKISSQEAVNKYKQSVLTPTAIEKKSKDNTTVKKPDDGKIPSKANAKLQNKKRNISEKALIRSDKNKNIVTNKSTTKEVASKENSKDYQSKPNLKTSINESKSELKNDFIGEKNENIVEDKTDSLKKDTEKILSITETVQNEEEKLNTSYTIAENELNTSLSSQDLMETEKVDDNINQIKFKNIDEIKQTVNVNANTNIEVQIERVEMSHEKKLTDDQAHKNIDFQTVTDKSKIKHHDSEDKNIKFETISSQLDGGTDGIKNNVHKNNLRPPTVRPSSSRPGAPRIREKPDTSTSADENIILGKVNIIVEDARIEDEEDTSIIIVEQNDVTMPSQKNIEALQLSSNEHGHLVHQILESQKQFSHNSGKTEIEWQFGAQKAREALNQEIEKLRFDIQAMSRVANPLGKMLDHIQEDVEVMRQELQQWTTIYDEMSKEIQKQKAIYEDSLSPLHAKLKELSSSSDEKHDKITDLKIIIHKNSSRIESLLAKGSVQ